MEGVRRVVIGENFRLIREQCLDDGLGPTGKEKKNQGHHLLLVTASPAPFSEFCPEPELAPVFQRWEKDLQSMFDDLGAAN